MPRKLSRRQLLKAGAGASAVTLGLAPGAVAPALAQDPAVPKIPGVDMSHECTVVDPEHYKLEFENEYVRVIRCRIPPHDQVKMHNHPVGSVTILLTDQHLHQTLEDGTKQEANNNAGRATWGNGTQRRHMGLNYTDQPYEYVRVDIKAAVPRNPA